MAYSRMGVICMVTCFIESKFPNKSKHLNWEMEIPIRDNVHNWIFFLVLLYIVLNLSILCISVINRPGVAGAVLQSPP